MWHLAFPSFSDSPWLGSTQITLTCIGLDVPPVSPPLWTKGDFFFFACGDFSKVLFSDDRVAFCFKGACGSSRPAVVSLLNYRGSGYRAQVCFVVTFHRSDCAPVSRNAYSWGRQKKSTGITINRSELALREKTHTQSRKLLWGLCHFQPSKSKRVNSVCEKGEKKNVHCSPPSFVGVICPPLPPQHLAVQEVDGHWPLSQVPALETSCI